MIIDCISDIHGFYPELEGGDLLIVAGDLTARDNEDEWHQCMKWLLSQDYDKKIFISGNHDNRLQKYKLEMFVGNEIEYLCDSGTEFKYEEPIRDLFNPNYKFLVDRKKLKIWGSPWTRRFKGMNPKCMAFTVDTDKELAKKWALIPRDIDILVTHSPPKYGLDKTITQDYVGSLSLTNWVFKHQPKVHIFGHVHERYGIIDHKTISSLNKKLTGIEDQLLCKTTIVNASHVNERYEPVNKPIRVIL